MSNESKLISAARYGDVEIVRELLTTPGINVNAKDDKWGYSPLILAARFGYIEIVKDLLAAPGIDVNARDDEGNSALLLSVSEGRTEAVQTLLTFQPQDGQPGINVNAKNEKGYSM